MGAAGCGMGAAGCVMRGCGDAGMRGCGEAGIRGSGEAGMRGCGDAGMRGCGDAGKRGCGDAGKRGCGLRDAGMRGCGDAGMRGCGLRAAGCGMWDAGTSPSFPLNFPAHLMHQAHHLKAAATSGLTPSSRISADSSKSKYISILSPCHPPPPALDLGLRNYGSLSKFYRSIYRSATYQASPAQTIRGHFLEFSFFTHLKPPLLISYKREPAQIYLDSRCYKGFC